MRFHAILLSCFLQLPVTSATAQEIVTVRPKKIDDVLVNPGVGFMTFQRFNGDDLNQGVKWTEGYPIEYQQFKGKLENRDHPSTSIAYFRIYWKFIEPELQKYRWELIDTALKTARERGQTLMLRIAPYGTESENDVPGWYRQMLGEESGKLPVGKWRTNPEDPRYLRYFGGMIRELGKRYDSHPDLEAVDVSIVGAWGEGEGTNLLARPTREGLVDCYIDTFRNTPLLMQLADEKTMAYALSRQHVGWRVDCLGDMGGFSKTWSHMYDLYPEDIIKYGARDAWQKAPVSLEVCWVMQHWKNQGWDVDYIIDQSLKWHISSFNAKSSPVPAEWWPQVNRWLKRMGYRFALRRFTYPSIVRSPGVFEITSWWENEGVAPCYRKFPLALRMTNETHSEVLTTAADITSWMPGDNLYDDRVVMPAGVPPGDYDLEIALLDPVEKEPRVKLAIEGRKEDGWYPLGKIKVQP